MDDFLTRLAEFNQSLPSLPGRAIMTRVCGSRSFNLNGPDSDWDWYGVYVTPTSRLLSLDPPVDKVAGQVPNYQFHELRLFAKLLRAGNPDAIISMCCERMIHVTDEWSQLRLMRHRFLTQKLVENCVHYAEGQLKKYRKGASVHTSGGKPGEKWLYHIIRLGKDALRLAEGKEPVVWKEGDERDLIMKVRRREIPEENIVSMAEGMFAAVRRMTPYPLPAEPDVDALENWMLRVRNIR